MPAPYAPNTVFTMGLQLVLHVMERRGIRSDKGPFPAATTADKSVNL